MPLHSILRTSAYGLVVALVSLAPAAARGGERGARQPEDDPTWAFDCRQDTETGYRVPHERLVWMPPPTVVSAASPVAEVAEARPGVLLLDFGMALDPSVVLDCGGPTSDLIRGVVVRDQRVEVSLGGVETRWRLASPEPALVVWSPLRIAGAISRAWPGAEATALLAEARALAVEPPDAADLERRLRAAQQRQAGMVALAEGRHVEAAEALRVAFEAVPNDVEAGLALARAHYRLRAYDDAEELLELLASAAPRSVEIRHEQGLLALSRARHAEARDHFRAAAAGGWVGASFYLGFLAFAAEDDDAARQALEAFLARAGDHPMRQRAETMLDLVRERQASRAATRVRSPPPPAADPVPAAPPAPAASSRAPPPRATLAPGNVTLRGHGRPDRPLRALLGRPLVLHLWATWCPPCRREMPSLMRFVSDALPELAADGLTLVTVSMDYTEHELAEVASRWTEEHAGALPAIYWDPDWRVAEQLGLGSALPQTLLIQPDGSIEAVHVGAQDWQHADWLDRLRRLAGYATARLGDDD